MMVGATIMMAVTSAAIRILFFVPTTFRAHITATIMAMAKKRGCMNVARANQPPTDATTTQNFLSIVVRKVERISPAIIMKQEAIGASYPTAREESERVGLRVIKIDAQKARNFNELLRSLLVKK